MRFNKDGGLRLKVYKLTCSTILLQVFHCCVYAWDVRHLILFKIDLCGFLNCLLAGCIAGCVYDDRIEYLERSQKQSAEVLKNE